MKQPNVLFVFGDQWRASSTGFDGNPDVKTPHLDSFARESIHLPNAVALCPVCTPWRGTFLTGQTPDKHGLFLNDAPLNPDLPTIGKAFKSAGYDTGWIGKWHVDGHGRMKPIPPERHQGFDYWKVLECTHNYNESYYYDHDDPTMRLWEGYDAIAQTKDAVQWIQNRSSGCPFFLSLSWGPPHNPYDSAPEAYRNLYDPDALHIPPNVPPDLHQDEKFRNSLAGYYAHCSTLDDCFGSLMQCLEAQGIAEDTVVVFTSDHGDFVGAYGLYDKQGPWDESARVPLLIRHPARFGTGGRKNDLVFNTLDFYPTLCALAGVEVPAEAGLDGHDRSGVLDSGEPPDSNLSLIAAYHTFGNWPKNSARRGDPLYFARDYRGIRTATHTYVIDHNGPWLLYHNLQDPHQTRNLIDDPAHATVREQLAGLLSEEMKRLQDDFLDGFDYVEKWGYKVNETGTIDPRQYS
jgi:arylsulfatase A-like enzyme